MVRMLDRVKNEYSRDKADLSTTQLIDAPRIVQLKDRYADKLPSNPRDTVLAVEGTILHGILEELAKDDPTLIAERRFYKVVRGKLIGGKVDLLEPMGDGYRLVDYKRTGTWPGVRDSWMLQANVNKWLVEQSTDMKVYELAICAMYSGWKEKDLLSRPSGTYPEEPIMMLPVEMWPEKAIRSVIEDRVESHLEATRLDDHELPFCTEKERWVGEARYAVIKEGNTRASRVFDTELEAINYRGGEEEFRIEERFSATRCNYCELQPVCNQYQTLDS
jgi:hypothetical protein